MTRTFRGPFVIALMLIIRGHAIGAQAASSASSPDSTPPKARSTSDSDWNGLYVGAHAGVSSGHSARTTMQPGTPNLSGSLSFFHPYDVFDGSGSQFGGLTAARGRIGDARNRWLYYATGGLAWTRDQFNRTGGGASPAGGPPGGTIETAFAGRIGWTGGGGIEALVARGWTVKAEYLYSQFGNTSILFPAGAQVTTSRCIRPASA